MKAVTWCGTRKVNVDTVPDPKILNPRDAIIRISSTCICGSDLHLYDGYIPTMRKGDILGHEFMGEVVEIGPGVDKSKIKVGDRVIVPFCIACGNCFYCKRQLFSCCDNSNPNAWMGEKAYGFATAGLFGYSHLTGGYAGGQAELARVPFADHQLFKVPASLPDEQVVFLTDIFPTGYMAAENCNIQPGDTVGVWGCGPVGQFAIRSAFLLGAERVLAIDSVAERLEMAKAAGAFTLHEDGNGNTFDQIRELTGGMGPDCCIDAVGMEAHGTTIDAKLDKAKQAVKLTMGLTHVLRQVIHACRKGGTVSVPGVYAGFIDKFPFGMAFAKGLTMKMGQTHVHKYMRPLLKKIEEGKIDPSFVITHRLALDDAPTGYDNFRKKEDNCIKIVLKP